MFVARSCATNRSCNRLRAHLDRHRRPDTPTGRANLAHRDVRYFPITSTLPLVWPIVRDSPSVPVVEHGSGEARIVTYTVLTPDSDGRLVALLDLADGTRTIASSTDADVVKLATEEELCGRRVRIDGAQLYDIR